MRETKERRVAEICIHNRHGGWRWSRQREGEGSVVSMIIEEEEDELPWRTKKEKTFLIAGLM